MTPLYWEPALGVSVTPALMDWMAWACWLYLAIRSALVDSRSGRICAGATLVFVLTWTQALERARVAAVIAKIEIVRRLLSRRSLVASLYVITN